MVTNAVIATDAGTAISASHRTGNMKVPSILSTEET